MKPLPLVAAAALAAYLVVRRRSHGRVELGIGAVVIAALVAYGAGLIHPPNIEHLVKDAGTALGPYTYVLVGVMAFLETGAFVGLLAPGETVILVGGVVAGQGEISIVALIALIWACAVAGDLTSFLLGRRLGRDFMLRHGPRVKITNERLEQVERFFERHGGKAILLGRFVGLVRAVAPFIAGSSGMPLRRFLPYDIVGAGLWGTTFALLGYVFWQSFDRVAALASKGALALAAVIVVVVGAIVSYRWLRDPANRRRAHAWLHEQGERPLLRPLAAVARVVAWRGIVPAWRVVSGPLRFTGERLTPGNLGLELTTLVAVAAVGGFVFFALLDTIGAGPTAIDLRAFDVGDGLRTQLLVDVAKAVTALGALPVVGGATLGAVVALLARRERIEAAVLAIGLALTVAAVQLAKAAEGRPRPADPLTGSSGLSYPSGHAAYSVFYVAIAVALLRGTGGIAGRAAIVVAALALAAAIGLTRVGLRAHYLTDVLGGWGVAAALLGACGVIGLLVGHLRQNGARA